MATVIEAIDLAKKYLSSKQFSRAERIYREILAAHPDQPDALCGLGSISHQQGSVQTAEQYFLDALKVNPDFVDAWFNLGNLYQTLNQAVAAEACYRLVLAQKPDSAVGYNNLAYSLQQQSRIKEAIDLYRKSLAISPGFREAAANLGMALHSEGLLSLQEQVDYAHLNFDLGLARFQGQDFQTSVVYFRQAIALQPDLADAHFNLGIALQVSGEWMEALACFQQTLNLTPDRGEVYFRLGQLYQDQGKLQDAISAYQQGIGLLNPCYARALEEENFSGNFESIQPTLSSSRETVQVGEEQFPVIPPVSESLDKRPFWSVVIPAYQRPDYLLECLASVLSQWPGDSDMEILVVDDASTPPLCEVVQAIGVGIVRYFRNPQNLGQQGTWNAGVILSRGLWVHLLHDDDYVLPGFYTRLQQSLKSCPNSVGAAFTGYANINDERQVIFSQQVYKESRGIAKDFLQKIGVANPLNPPAVVIRRSVYEELGGYHPELTATLDWELYKRVSTFYDWWYEPDILVHYRQHSKSMRTGLLVTGTRTKSIRRSIEISETYLPHSLVKEVTAKARQCYFEMCLEDIAVPLKAGNVDGALLMLREVLKINHSPAAIEKLFHWLTEDKAVDLRAAIVQKLISNPINASLKS